jgi:hypothetical protein
MPASIYLRDSNMPQVPGAVQSVLDRIEAQIEKERRPLVNVLLGTPLFLIVALPIGFIVGVVVVLFTGTLETVGQGDTTPGIVAGVLMMLTFWAYAAYGTYRSSKTTATGGE